MWTEMSNQAILLEIGERVKNILQKKLAAGSGVGLSTVIRLEIGIRCL